MKKSILFKFHAIFSKETIKPPHWYIVHSYGPLAFLVPFVFRPLHHLVTCRPFSVKLSHLEQAALFYVSIFFSVSSSTLLCLERVQLRSLLVLFLLFFSYTSLFSSFLCVNISITFLCFLVSSSFFFLSFFFCYCCFILPVERPKISIMLLANRSIK